ncbi:hypothetical protein C8R44DRAFT_726204 [Mycena epipterygia]|nr:hypothetical protein C8R44DRAFT_726204 [Mycena epipterygia]
MSVLGITEFSALLAPMLPFSVGSRNLPPRDINERQDGYPPSFFQFLPFDNFKCELEVVRLRAPPRLTFTFSVRNLGVGISRPAPMLPFSVSVRNLGVGISRAAPMLPFSVLGTSRHARQDGYPPSFSPLEFKCSFFPLEKFKCEADTARGVASEDGLGK